MNKPRILTPLVSVVFLLTLVSSVRADSVHLPPGLQKFNLADIQTVQLFEIDRVDVREFLAEHFQNNNGNHFGFVNSLEAAGNNGKHLGVGTNLDTVAGSNGKHLGFSVSAFNGGVKFGLSNPRRPNTPVNQNPEPTGMLLLGTGLAAVAAYARKRRRRRTQEH